MRILVVCPYDLDLPGGVQNQAIGMARTFSLGHNVTLAAPGLKEQIELSRLGVEVRLLGKSIPIRANGSVAPIALSFRALPRLARAFHDARPELVIVHEPLVPLVSIASLFARGSERIGTFHRSGSSRAFPFLRYCVWPFLSRVDKGVVVSEDARQTIGLLTARAHEFALIPNAIDVGRFRRPTSGDRDKKTILFLGRHEPRKGLEVLLEAMQHLSSDYTLWIAGEGPSGKALQERYALDARCHWLGRLSDDEVVAKMHEAELFVAPSLGGESFGVILLEAMAAGLPVLCSDIAGYHNAAGDVARYVPPGDSVKLAKAIDALSGDDEARARLSVRGQDRADQYQFDGLCRAYLDLLDDRGR